MEIVKNHTTKMASKYLPPHIRNKNVGRRHASREQDIPEETTVPTLDTSDQSFPQLGACSATDNKWTGKKSFASLATEWKDADETARAVELTNESDSRLEFTLPRFTNRHHYVEVEEYRENNEEKTKVACDDEDDGWTEVKQKVRFKRELTLEEKYADIPEEDMKRETCWNEEETTEWN